MEQQIQEFLQQLPEELQQKIAKLPPEQQMQVVEQLMAKAQGGTAEYGSSGKVGIEAERNENITVPKDSERPVAQGGYLKKLSENPDIGEVTYEIPDDAKNQTHEQGGVDLDLEGDSVINSDKLKIKSDFKVYNKNFKGKSFKDASDFLSRKEKDLQERFNDDRENSTVDDTSETSLSLMLAKLSMNRKELNDLQESALAIKKSRDKNKTLSRDTKKFGGLVQSNNNYYKAYVNSMDKPSMIKAEQGLNLSIERFNKFADSLTPETSIEDFAKEAVSQGIVKNIKSDRSLGIDYKPLKKLDSDIKGRALEANNFFIEKGYSPLQASAITGNLMQESKLDPTVTNKTGAFGIAQWLGDRKVKLGTWADQNGLNKYDFKTQLEFVNFELKNSHKGANKALLSAQSMEDAVLAIRKKYEIPGEAEAMDNKRLSYAHFVNQMTDALGSQGQQDQQQFEYGGQVSTKYSGGGYVPKFKEGSKESKDYYQKVIDYYRNYPIEGQRYTGDGSISDWQNYMVNTFGKSMIAQFMNGDAGNTNKGKKLYNTDLLDEDQAAEAFKDGKFAYRAPIVVPTTDMDLDDASTMDGDYFTFNNNRRQASDTVPLEGQRFYTKMLPDVKFNINGEKETFDTRIQAYNLDHTFSVPFPKDTDEDTSPGDLVGNPQYPDEPQEQDITQENTRVQSSSDKTSFLDRLKAGFRDVAPYAAAMARLFEGRISPVLQQKPYQNPYDNYNTDYDIQANLNNIDRTTLAGMADSRGNPSVRNARMAQLYANAQAAKNPLYSKKYNTENQLKNQREVGRMNYLNQFTDTNMAYKKRFEQEWLQTLENERQQKYMAMDYMTNVGLRKAEENAIIQLGLANSVYDYDPITHKLKLNPEKALQHAKEMKYTYRDNTRTIQELEQEIKKLRKAAKEEADN